MIKSQLDKDGSVHLSDFGLAVPKASLSELSASTWQGRGKPTGGFYKKNMVGTLQYMAPEVLNKKLHSEKSDVFSFAITIKYVFAFNFLCISPHPEIPTNFPSEFATGVFPYSDLTTDAKVFLDF